MKTLKLLLIITLFCTNIFGQETTWIKFDWIGDTLAGKYVQKAYMFIPFKLSNLPYEFNVQFDLGAINSMLYGNSIKPYFVKHPEFNSKIDTNKVAWIQSQKYPSLTNVNILLDNKPFNSLDLAIFNGFGDTLTMDSINTKTIKNIGTIGPDIFQNQILIIDYPNQRIGITRKLPENLNHEFQYVNFKINEGRIKLPVIIDGKKRDLLFDTGSSSFNLYTNFKNAQEVLDKSAVFIDSVKISTWGVKYYVYGYKISKNIQIGKLIIPSTVLYYTKRDDFDYWFESEQLWGITGNSFFFDKTIVIDYANKQFGFN
jgi:hypothetical protein